VKRNRQRGKFELSPEDWARRAIPNQDSVAAPKFDASEPFEDPTKKAPASRSRPPGISNEEWRAELAMRREAEAV
jgi:hypothetical protein